MRWLLLIAVIVAAHIALWLSEMDPAMKLRLTLLNAAGWTVVLAPIALVGRWLRAVETRNARAEGAEGRTPRDRGQRTSPHRSIQDRSCQKLTPPSRRG